MGGGVYLQKENMRPSASRDGKGGGDGQLLLSGPGQDDEDAVKTDRYNNNITYSTETDESRAVDGPGTGRIRPLRSAETVDEF